MTSRRIVLIDACVLHSALVRDIFLELDRTALLQIRWSAKILDETKRSIIRRKPECAGGKLDALFEYLMPYSVSGYCDLMPEIQGLKDPNDRHVLAAAIKAKASLLVTWNLRDFPNRHLHPFALEAISPDRLLHALVLEASEDILNCIQTVFSRRRIVDGSIEYAIEHIARTKLGKTARALTALTHP